MIIIKNEQWLEIILLTTLKESNRNILRHKYVQIIQIKFWY